MSETVRRLSRFEMLSVLVAVASVISLPTLFLAPPLGIASAILGYQGLRRFRDRRGMHLAICWTGIAVALVAGVLMLLLLPVTNGEPPTVTLVGVD